MLNREGYERRYRETMRRERRLRRFSVACLALDMALIGTDVYLGLCRFREGNILRGVFLFCCCAAILLCGAVQIGVILSVNRRMREAGRQHQMICRLMDRVDADR